MTVPLFWKNCSKVALRSAIIQIASLAVLPVLTQMYPPASFGLLAVFLAVTGVAAAVANGRFELAINTQTADADAWGILRLCILVSVGFSLLVACIVLCIPGSWLLDLEPIGILIPIFVFFTSSTISMTAWLTRMGRYDAYAALGVLQTGLIIIAQLVAGWLKYSAFGLVVAQCVGVVIGSVITMGYIYLRCPLNRQANPDNHTLRELAQLNINFPVYLLPAHLINTVAAQVPVFFVTQYFGAHAAGVYHVAARVTLAPAGLIGGAIGQVFYPEAARQFRDSGTCLPLLRSTVSAMLVPMLVATSVVALGGYFLADSLLGVDWHGAGMVIVILSLGNLIRSVNAPVSGIWMIAQRQKLDLVWQIFMIIAILAGLYAGYVVTRGINGSLIGYGVGVTIAFGINLWVCYKLAIGSGPVTQNSAKSIDEQR